MTLIELLTICIFYPLKLMVVYIIPACIYPFGIGFLLGCLRADPSGIPQYSAKYGMIYIILAVLVCLTLMLFGIMIEDLLSNPLGYMLVWSIGFGLFSIGAVHFGIKSAMAYKGKRTNKKVRA